VEACEHSEASSLDILRSDLREKNAHWEYDEAHREDVPDDISEDNDEAIGNAECQVVARYEQDSEGRAEQANHNLRDRQIANFHVFEPAAEDERADEHACVVQNGDHRVLELCDAHNIKHEVVVESAEIGQQGVESHPDDDGVDLFDLEGFFDARKTHADLLTHRAPTLGLNLGTGAALSLDLVSELY